MDTFERSLPCPTSAPSAILLGMSQAVPQTAVADDRLTHFRRLREQLAPARDPSETLALEVYVERSGSCARRIATELLLAPGSSHVLIGGIGSGKTTELLAVQKALAGSPDTLALYLDVSVQHDIAKMKPGVVVAQAALAIADWVRGIGLEGHSNEVRWSLARIRDFALGYVATEDYPEQDYPITPGILEPVKAAEATSMFASRIGEVLTSLGALAPRFVILVDGLDRMTNIERFEEVVRNDISALSKLGLGVVLVGPLRALYGIDRALLDLFDRFHYQPWLDVRGDAGAGAFLRELLTRRVPSGTFEDSAVDSLVASSGGVLRDLLALAQSACVEAYLHGGETVGVEHVQASIDAFGRKQMQGLRGEELQILRRLVLLGEFVHTSEDDLGLLMTRRVLEYRGTDERPRYVVHPTIVPFVQ